MFRHLTTIVLAVFLLSTGPIEARRSSGGGGFSSRGMSGSRSGVSQGGGGFNQGPARPGPVNNGGFRQNQGGFQPNAGGGFHPNPNVRPNSHFNNGGGFHPNSNQGFRQGTGLGSTSSRNTFTKALVGGALGAAGGILAYEAGKAIIKSATQPFNYNGRDYHWDNNGQVRAGEFQCSMPLSQLAPQETTTTTTTTVAPVDDASTVEPTSTTTLSPQNVLQNVQYQDGTRPKTIVWTCKQGRESCCGTDCCPLPVQNQNVPGNSAGNANLAPGAGSVALIVFIVLLLLCCGGCLCAYFCCKSLFDCNGDKRDEAAYQDEYYNQQQYQMQNYPPHAQNGHQYPPQQQYGGYPNSGNYYPPNQYPAQPTY